MIKDCLVTSLQFGVFEIESAITAKYCDDNANTKYLSDLTDANRHFTQTNLLSSKKRAQTDSKPISNVNVDQLKVKLNAHLKQPKELSIEQFGCDNNNTNGYHDLIGPKDVSERCSDELQRMESTFKHIVDTNARNCEKHCALQHSIKGKVIDIDEQQLNGVIHRAKQLQQIQQTINVFKTYF